MLPIHEQLYRLDLNINQMDFDAASLYPSAMWDKDSVYPKIETSYTFKPQMNDVFVNDFNNQTLAKMVMTPKFYRYNVTIHQILYFNIYQLKKMLKNRS